MEPQQSMELAHRARTIYEAQLRARLESSNLDDFVAIEPESAEYFLGKTLSEAIQAARAAHANRLPFVFRVGHAATIEMGVINA
jgi:hypothetical protein